MSATGSAAQLAAIAQARELFLELVAEVRPELHRYCARMTGSIFDGEDLVQETLAKAHYALGQMSDAPPLRPWLFRIAHNVAMDFLKRYERKNVDLVAEPPDIPDDVPPAPEIVAEAIVRFTALVPAQRSALVLKDVLELSLEETAEVMGTSVSAVKAALVRARRNVARMKNEPPAPAPEDVSPALLAQAQRYAQLFNARDWDGLRALLGEESRLEIVSRHLGRGAAVGVYWNRYAEICPVEELRAHIGWVEGEVLVAMFRPASGPRPAYFVRLAWDGDLVGSIRDYRYVPYIAEDARYQPLVP